MVKRLLTDLDFVDFWDYFGQISILFWVRFNRNEYIRMLILPPKKESKFGSKEPKNRLKPNPLTVSKMLLILFLAMIGPRGFGAVSEPKVVPLQSLTIKNVRIEVELATTQESRAKGLSGRKTLPEGTGMLFIYEKAQICHFWMKDTTIALSIGFFDEDRHLIEWKDMPAPGENPLTLISSKKPSLYALEVPQGWFARHNIEPGAQFSYIPVPPQSRPKRPH
jgi:uncharacterized membrane protein (UPF0127 family)